VWTCGTAGDRISRAHAGRAVGYGPLHDTLVATGILMTAHAPHVFDALAAMATESTTAEERKACAMYVPSDGLELPYCVWPSQQPFL
jgi:hypothetical protein